MQNALEINQGQKNKARIIAISVHLLLLGLLIFFKLSIPNPPPAEKGIMIAFGTSEKASGNEQAEVEEIEEIQKEITQSEASSSVESQDNVLTQDYYEAPVIKEEKSEIKKEEIIKEEKTEENKENLPEVSRPVLDMSALYTGKKTDKNKNNNQGKSEGQGDEGKLSGDPSSNTKGEKNYGLGDEGFAFSLNGRSILSKPVIKHSSQTTGVIVIRIQVNVDGQVVSANYTPRGSTSSDPYLIGIAKKAAEKSRFSPHPSGQNEQWGSITFVFKVK